MRKRNKFYWLLLSPFMFNQVWANSNLTQEIQQLLNKNGINQQDIAVCFDKLDDKEQTNIAINPSQKMIPASLTKITTAYTVLKKIPPNYKIKTRLMTKASVQKNTLMGDLYFVGGGDPAFVSESMWQLVNNFYRTGIRKIEGDILVDNRLFETDQYAAFSDSHRAYQALTSAASFNWNSINIYVRPSQLSQKASVWLDPQSDWNSVDNQIETVLGSKKNISVTGDISTNSQLKLVGQLGTQVDEYPIFRSIQQPEMWTGHQLNAFLKQRGILVTGHIKLIEGLDKEPTILLAEVEAKKPGQIVQMMMKYSNNFVAKMLTLHLPIIVNQQKQGTLDKGMQVIQQTLIEAGLTKDQFELYDPAGLSKSNRITCQALNKLQKNIWQDSNIFPEYLAALPIAANDGTLRNRFTGKKYSTWVRAKTGLLTGAVGLAGFTQTKKGQNIAFSLIYNGQKKLPYQVQVVFDDIVDKVIQSW